MRAAGLLLAIWALAADPAKLSPKLEEDLAEIRQKLDRIDEQVSKLDARELQLGLEEVGEWIDELVAEAGLAEDAPLVHGLRERVHAIEKKSAASRNPRRPAMPNPARLAEANREKFEALLKLEVDLQKVSFKRDVAPIIAERCLGCHNANRKGGEFDASTYESFVSEVTPGKPADSHLLHLVTGKEQPRMPRGNAGFDVESVAIWTAWIEQGAKFDGPAKDVVITSYLVDADSKRREKIARLTAAEIDQLHQLAGDRQIEIVKPKRPVATFQTPNFQVRTTLSAADAEYVAVLAEAILEEVGPRYGVDRPLWTGGLGLTVFRDRYDYLAFAKSIDNYEPEGDEVGHVRLRPEFSYIAMTSEAPGRSLDLLVAEQVLSAFFRSLGKGGMPDWGVHGSAAIEAEAWDPARAPSLRAELRKGAGEMMTPGWKGSLFKGELPWVQAAPLATSLFAYLRAERKRDLVRFQKELAAGQPVALLIRDLFNATEEEFREAWYAWTIQKYGR
jgi:hypothetical protein